MNTRIRLCASELFGVLSNPTRLSIMELLENRELSVTEIAERLELNQSSASQHLAILARAGVLAVEPRGALRCYRVRGPRIVRILNLIEEFCTIHELYGSAEEPGAKSLVEEQTS